MVRLVLAAALAAALSGCARPQPAESDLWKVVRYVDGRR